MSSPAARQVVRFTRLRRAEHLLVMIGFTLLVVTGLPQRFHDQRWAIFLVEAVGGLGNLRFIHRFFGVLFTLQFSLHVAGALHSLFLRRRAPVMAPTMRDVRQAIQSLKYQLRLSEEHPRFDRYEYRQKFEYWGMVIGGMVMIATGFILWKPLLFSAWLPAELIPVSRVAHSNEAFLAFMVILFWHIYGAHLNPEVFPFDKSIFTGKISEERMKAEHPLEYERLRQEGKLPPSGD